MTVAFAVIKGDRAVLAADSLVNFGGQRYPVANCRFHKLVRVGESVMAWAGWSIYAELLHAHLAAAPPPPLDSEADVFSFFVRLWRTMRDDYTFTSGGGQVRDHPFVDLDSVFLLINRAGIFRVAPDMDVTQFDQYCAVGSGAKYALGAARVLYDQHDDPAEIARRSVQVGIDFDVYCGGEVDLIELDVDQILRQRSKRI
jgi:ATP-dependent HslUV protease, peptidase subunit HslV